MSNERSTGAHKSYPEQALQSSDTWLFFVARENQVI